MDKEIRVGNFVSIHCFDGSTITMQVTEVRDNIVYGVSQLGNHWANLKDVEKVITQEEKDLLFKDLCARLPYGVMCSIADYEEEHWNIHGNGSVVKYDDKPVRATGVDIDSKIIRLSGSVSSVYASDDFSGLKPYIRPMSSMTEEEKTWYYLYGTDCPTCAAACAKLVIDWLNAHYFDYRGLIPMGLALEAFEGMYKL